MRLLSFLLVLAFLGCAELAYGQKDESIQQKTKLRSKKQISYSIADAQRAMQSDPELAIRMLNDVVARSIQEDDPNSTRAAYILLGDINYDNQLYTQAIDRFEKALALSNTDNTPEILYKLGQASLPINASRAQEYFLQCNSSINSNTLLCNEGLADAYNQLNAHEKALELLKELERNYRSTGGSDLARIQAKLADTYAAQKNIVEAQLNYRNARNNFQTIEGDQDPVILQNASKNLSEVQSYDDNVNLRKENIGYYEDNNKEEEAVIERLELAEVYVSGGQADEAQSNLDKLKPIISEYPANEVKAEYYKTSSEVYAAEGEYRKAVEAFQQYSDVQDSVYSYREKELNKRIAISNLQKDVDVSEKESINRLDRSKYEESLVEKQQWLIYLLSLLLLGALLSAYLIYRNVQSKQRANKLLELRSLRSEMNPHFIFNALGNVNEYIAANDERKANRFLSDFSKLMRLVLELNKNDLIPLQQEIDLSKLYLKLEHARWNNKFDYDIDIPEFIEQNELSVPPLLLQPYIENAVWHGLRYLDGQGKLSIQLSQSMGNTRIVIEDNGIGRARSTSLKTKNQKLNQSTGIKNTQRRAQIINELYDTAYQVNIEDAFPGEEHVGTRVTINLMS